MGFPNHTMVAAGDWWLVLAKKKRELKTPARFDQNHPALHMLRRCRFE